GTFSASRLSSDAERGGALYRAQIAVPIATQLRYYLEYMTDELEPRMEFVECPVLALTLAAPFGFENLSQSMRDQLVQRFGSLEEAKKQVRFGGPWESTLAARSQPGRVQLQELRDSGIFMMDDVPEAFDDAVAKFVASLGARASEAAGPGKDAKKQ